MTTTPALTAIVAYAETASISVHELEQSATELNLLPDIPWHVRARIRTVEGHLSNLNEDIIEVLDGVGTDESEDLIEKLYGPPTAATAR